MILYETERLILREWSEQDIEGLIQINQDKSVMKHFPRPYTAEETLTGITNFKNHQIKHGYSIWPCALKSTNSFIGFVGLLNRDDMPFSPCIEIGWRLSKEHWNNGYATEAALKCLEVGFNQFRLNEIVSFTAKLNKASERVMQKIGMLKISNFEHPKLTPDHPLCEHVLYKIKS